MIIVDLDDPRLDNSALAKIAQWTSEVKLGIFTQTVVEGGRTTIFQTTDRGLSILLAAMGNALRIELVRGIDRVLGDLSDPQIFLVYGGKAGSKPRGILVTCAERAGTATWTLSPAEVERPQSNELDGSAGQQGPSRNKHR